MYNRLYSPVYKTWININSNNGKKHLKKYIKFLIAGANVINKSFGRNIEWHDDNYTKKIHNKGDYHKYINEYIGEIGLDKLPGNDISFDTPQKILAKYTGYREIASYKDMDWKFIVLENKPDGHCFYRTVLRGLYDMYDIINQKLQDVLGNYNPNYELSKDSWESIKKLRLLTLEYITEKGKNSQALETMKNRISNGVLAASNENGVGYDDYVDSFEIEYVGKMLNELDDKKISFLIWNPAVSNNVTTNSGTEIMITPPSWNQSYIVNKSNKYIMMINTAGVHFDSLIPIKKSEYAALIIQKAQRQRMANNILKSKKRNNLKAKKIHSTIETEDGEIFYISEGNIVLNKMFETIGKYVPSDDPNDEGEIVLDDDEDDDENDDENDDEEDDEEDDEDDEDELAYIQLIEKMDSELPDVMEELNKYGSKKKHWSWWVWPHDTPGKNEPNSTTYLNEKTAHILLDNAPEIWKDVLVLIANMIKENNYDIDKIIPKQDWYRIQKFILFWENITEKRNGWSNNKVSKDDLKKFILPTFRKVFENKAFFHLTNMGFLKKDIKKVLKTKLNIDDILDELTTQGTPPQKKKKKRLSA